MDFFRRLHQSSYPPRPSPLGNSQESRDDRPRSYGTPSSPQGPHRDIDQSQPSGRYEYQSPTPASHLYSPGASRASQPRKDDGISPPRNQHTPLHRRHASLETRQHSHAHRRNNSQPQSGQYRPGKRMKAFFGLLRSSCDVSMSASCAHVVYFFPQIFGFGLAPGVLRHVSTPFSSPFWVSYLGRVCWGTLPTSMVPPSSSSDRPVWPS